MPASEPSSYTRITQLREGLQMMRVPRHAARGPEQERRRTTARQSRSRYAHPERNVKIEGLVESPSALRSRPRTNQPAGSAFLLERPALPNFRRRNHAWQLRLVLTASAALAATYCAPRLATRKSTLSPSMI